MYVLLKDSSQTIMTSQSPGAVMYLLNPEAMEQIQPKSHKSNANLVPNQAIDVAEKDPAFDLRYAID